MSAGTDKGNENRAVLAAQAEAQWTETDARIGEHQAKCDAFQQRRAEVAPTNRAALFAALAAAGIHTVVVTFDGYGDDGQIESIGASTADNAEVALPNAPIEVRDVAFETASVTPTPTSAREIIEAMAYDLLSETHDGWENNNGAYGAFTFSVPGQAITLDYNARFIDSTNYQHEL